MTKSIVQELEDSLQRLELSQINKYENKDPSKVINTANLIGRYLIRLN
jgi:hypothetical protein